MPTKEELEAENARLKDNNETLRQQLASAGATATAGRAATPQHRFQLSEGDRQELEIRGVVNINGRMWTREEVLAEIARTGPDEQGHNDQRNVQIAEAPEATRVAAANLPGRGPGVAGVDYVWPSVERGKIDPEVAGTPGISGPPASDSE